MSHRSPEPGLEPEGEAVPIVHHQHVLVLPRPRLRSCRRPLHASPASGRYSLPRPVLDRLQAALAPAKNREAALVLAVFLARYWSAPARLGQAFPIDRRALVRPSRPAAHGGPGSRRDPALEEGACRKLWRRPQDGLGRPSFQALLTCGRPKQTASSRFCSHTVQAPAKPKPLRSHSMASKPWMVRRAVWKD